MGSPLELQLKQATLLANVLEALSDMFSKAIFDFSSTGCEIQAMDTSGIALVSFLLRADAFDHYRCCRDLSMGLNLADMAEVFRCANNDDNITIKAEEGLSDALISFESPKKGEISYFNFDVVDIDGVPLQIVEYEHQAKVCLSSAQFMHICRKLSSFGDYGDTDIAFKVIISVTKNGVYFFARGKHGTSTIKFPPEETPCVEMKEEVSLMFVMRYIKSISKMSTLSDQVTISLSSNKPAVFEFKIAEMGDIRCYMLPVDEGEMQNEGDEMEN